VSNCFLFFTTRRQIHTNTCNTPDSDSTSPVEGYMPFFSSKKPVPLQRQPNTLSKLILSDYKSTATKNGRRRQIIAHHAFNNECHPVKACLARVQTLFQQNANLDTPLCAYRQSKTAPFTHITNSDSVKAVRTALNPTGAHKRGYKPKLVRSHSSCKG